MAEVLLGEAEKTFILHGVEVNLRTDGRSNSDIRPIELETDIVSNTTGSAHVKLANTNVLVGVKAQLETPKYPDRGSIEFFVDCSANATPEFEGRGGEDLANQIRSVLAAAYDNHQCLDLKKLCVLPGEQAWTLYADVLILECGGNLFDTVSIAVKAALFNTKIPSVTVSSCDGGQQEVEVSDDPYDCKRLDVGNSPILVTLARIGSHYVVDPSESEEHCSLASLVVGITEGGQVTTSRKLGSGSLHAESMIQGLQLGRQVGVKINKLLMKKLQEEETKKRVHRGFLG